MKINEMNFDPIFHQLNEDMDQSHVQRIKNILKNNNISKGSMKPFVKDDSIVILYWTNNTAPNKLVIENEKIISDVQVQNPAIEIMTLKSQGYELEEDLMGFFKRNSRKLMNIVKNNKKSIRYGGLGIIILIIGVVTFLTGPATYMITPSLLSVRSLFQITDSLHSEVDDIIREQGLI